MSEIKPCPFCAGKAEVTSKKVMGATASYVRCEKCGASGKFYLISTEYASHEKAIEAWNRRDGS